MNPKTAVLIFAGVVYVASLAALACLVGVGVVPTDVGVPLISSTVTLGLGASLALVDPGGLPKVTRDPGPAPSPVQAPTTAAQADPGPAPTGLSVVEAAPAGAPAMPAAP